MEQNWSRGKSVYIHGSTGVMKTEQKKGSGTQNMQNKDEKTKGNEHNEGGIEIETSSLRHSDAFPKNNSPSWEEKKNRASSSWLA